jgi:hypothetical protein
MPYASGETPEMGDYVKNKWEQPGTVMAIHAVQSGQEQISIRWDDGGADLPLTSAIEFTLLSRQKGEQPKTTEHICTDLEVPVPEVVDKTPSQELFSQSTLLGAAGEHYVMSQLLRRMKPQHQCRYLMQVRRLNYIAALAPRGVPSADIVITGAVIVSGCCYGFCPNECEALEEGTENHVLEMRLANLPVAVTGSAGTLGNVCGGLRKYPAFDDFEGRACVKMWACGFRWRTYPDFTYPKGYILQQLTATWQWPVTAWFFVDSRVSQARLWNCQQPLPSDAGHSAFVSADMIEDAHNCVWLLKFPHEALAGGSMYAFRLPEVLPAVGAPGGPPPESDFHTFGIPMPGYSDARLIFLNCIRDPNQLQPTMDNMMAQFAAEQARRAAQRHKH